VNNVRYSQRWQAADSYQAAVASRVLGRTALEIGTRHRDEARMSSHGFQLVFHSQATH
jgi:hypothetical protein